MPELKHYSIMIAELVFPVVILILSLQEILRLPELDRLVTGAKYIFIMLAQVGIWLMFLIKFVGAFIAIYYGLIEERKIVLMLKDRFEYAS